MTNIQPNQWYRVCQECGYKQPAIRPDPNKPLPPSYTEAKCKRCKSAALDYGKIKFEASWEDDQ
jgi:predicted nucleic-acid-binding Zn-ribbon protein